jgi:undecaprenyl-diphosphatase
MFGGRDMLILQAIILGIVQGLTEFIPISSSAHLIIIPWLFGWKEPALTSLSFDVALHLGTLAAVIGFFARDWVRLFKAGIASIRERKIGADNDRKLAWLLLIGCIPGGIAGVLGENKIDQLFHQPNVPIAPHAIIILGVIIAVLALILFIVERVAKHSRELDSLTLKDSFLIGLAQALAIFPGVSRSGSTITAGLALNLKRDDAARFSFLLSAPIIAGAGLKSAWDLFQQVHTSSAFTSIEWILFPIGVIAAAFSGYFCVKYLLRYLQNHSTDLFVFYRWGLATLIIVVALVRG